jgi:conjugative transposon TraK protein
MKILQNIDTSLKTMRVVMLGVVISSLVFSGYIYFDSQNRIEEGRNKVYLLSQGNALELTRSRDGKDNITAEIKNHITMWHLFFYNIDPDPVDIKVRVGKASFLIDDSGKLIDSKRNETNFYSQLVSGNISTRVYIDSIIPKLENGIYHCKIIARLKYIRSSKITEKHLDSECNIRSVARTDNNPHGFLIENYLLTNQTIINEQLKH